MLRRTQQRLSCGANTLALLLVFGVVILHVLHRRSAANVGPGDDQNVVFWFEAGDDGDDQPGFHRPFRMNLQLVLGAVGTFFIAALCDAGGIAGACTILGLFVPLYSLVAGFGLKEATALSQAAIAGASTASLAFNLFRSHPWDPTRPLVDLDLMLLLAPASLLGVSLGVLLNDLLPRWLITVLLVAILAHVCHREALIGLTAWHEESQQQAALQAAAAISSGPIPRLRPICTNSSSDSSPHEQQQQQQQQPKVAAAAVLLLPSIVAAAVVDSPDSSECSSSRCTAAAAAAAAGDISKEQSPEQQQQQGQQRQQQQSRAWFSGSKGTAHADDSSSSSSSGGSSSRNGLRQPLLPSGNTSDVAAAAAAREGSSQHPDSTAADGSSNMSSSSSSRVRHSRASHHAAAVPFMASVSLPQLASPFASSIPAAADAPTGPYSSAVFAGHVVSFSEFPWIKFLSMLMLCLGFCGLAVLGALIPLCTWYFVTYMVLFLLLTVLVTFMFIKFILIDPLCKAAAVAKVYSSMEQGGAAAAAVQGSRRRRSSSSSKRSTVRLSLRERLVTWANVLAGSQLAVQRPAAAAAAAAGNEQQQQQEQRQLLQNMSLFRREQLKHQLQLQQPFLANNTSFKNVGEAAAAAAAAVEAQLLLADDGGLQHGVDGLTPGAVTLVLPQRNSLIHIAAAGAVVTAAAGVVSGVCGLAGAELLGQTLLDFRVHPQVSTATSVLLVCAGSIAASLAFAVQGRLNISYALLFACVSVAGVCAGVWLIGGLVRKSCRSSFLMLLLAGLTGAAAFFTAVFGAQGFAHDLAEGRA